MKASLNALWALLMPFIRPLPAYPRPRFPVQHMMHTLATHVLETLQFIERRQLSQRRLSRLNEPTMEHL